jgi:hypothetical protein
MIQSTSSGKLTILTDQFVSYNVEHAKQREIIRRSDNPAEVVRLESDFKITQSGIYEVTVEMRAGQPAVLIQFQIDSLELKQGQEGVSYDVQLITNKSVIRTITLRQVDEMVSVGPLTCDQIIVKTSRASNAQIMIYKPISSLASTSSCLVM